MEFTYVNPDTQVRPTGAPEVVGIPSDPDGEFIIRDSQYGEQVVHQIDFPYVSPSLRPAMESGDETRLREHIVPQDEPGWFKLVNLIGYAAIRPFNRTLKPSKTVLVKVRDFKETQPFRPPNT